MQRIGWIADEVLPSESDGVAGGDHCVRGSLVVIGKDHERAYAEASSEGKPVKCSVPGAQLKVGGDVGALVVEGSGVIEEVRPSAEVEAARQGGCDVESGAAQTGMGFDTEAGKWPEGPRHRRFWRRFPQQALSVSPSGT